MATVYPGDIIELGRLAAHMFRGVAVALTWRTPTKTVVEGQAMSRWGYSVLLFIGLAIAVFGCRSDDKPPQTPTSQPAGTQPAEESTAVATSEQDAVFAENSNWSREQALDKLTNKESALTAAVRLARLSEIDSPILPDPLPADVAAELVVQTLSETMWAFGLPDQTDEAVLHAPLLIDRDGDVHDTEEPDEDMVLHIADDADIFPHLLIAPLRVYNVADLTETGLVLDFPDTLHFELRAEGEYSYLALVWPDGDEPVEVARYNWDPYELSFLGPAADKLPDPPGGRFEMELEACAALQPMGGEIPEPEEIEGDQPMEEEPPPY